MNATDSFVIGFNYGTFNGVELTAREIAIQFPDVVSEAFAQGNIDALANDRYRSTRFSNRDESPPCSPPDPVVRSAPDSTATSGEPGAGGDAMIEFILFASAAIFFLVLAAANDRGRKW